MDNNLFGLFSSLMGNNSSTSQSRASSYYPSDTQPFSDAQSNDFNPNMGGLLPMLLSLMGNNSQLGALSKIFSGGDAGALNSLLKDNKKASQETSETPLPHDDIIL